MHWDPYFYSLGYLLHVLLVYTTPNEPACCAWHVRQHHKMVMHMCPE